jgi:hypothetical protein
MLLINDFVIILKMLQDLNIEELKSKPIYLWFSNPAYTPTALTNEESLDNHRPVNYESDITDFQIPT